MRVLLTGVALSFFLFPLPRLSAGTDAQGSPEPLPRVVAHADPVYPQIARTAHITGDVVVRISTDGHSVVDAVAESGPPLLRNAAQDNAKTWKFAPHAPGIFRVTYRFTIAASDVATSFLNPPNTIDVIAPPPQVIIDWAWIGLGTWQADLRSSHGNLSQVFEFSFSGPEGKWLQVQTPSSPNKTADEKQDNGSQFGHKDGDFLVFSLRVAEPDGRRLETYLVGKLAADKLVGSFVDEAGVRGTWTATRMS